MAGVQHDDNAFAAASGAEHTHVAEPRTSGAVHSDPTAVLQTSSVAPNSMAGKRDLDTSSSSDADQEWDRDHDGLEFPTEEEKKTLRRIADSIPWTAYLIAIIELAERFSFSGSSAVFTNYIQQPLPPGSHTGAGGLHGQSGALGMGQRGSTGLTTFYIFWCNITPLLGAWIADTHWGRYKTICWGVFIALIGHIILIIAAVPGVIERKSAVGVFVISLITIGLGTGLFKANISPLIAEQYRRRKLFVVTTKGGERVIVDPVVTISRIYMYFYLLPSVGALVGQIPMTYSEKFFGFYLAYTLPTIVFLLCPIVLWIGRNRYIRSPHTGSVLATALHLWAHAAKGRWSWNPYRCYKNMTAADFWENAKPSNYNGPKPSWMTFNDNWVDEVRRGIKACSVFCWFPLYWITYNQLANNLTSQAATMATHGLPNDVLFSLNPFALFIFIPFCDLILYPALRRARINFSALKRITLGFFTGAAAMLWAAVVQHYIYKTSPCGYSASDCTGDQSSPLNIWIQTGSYVLIALSEIFASITGMEYAFTKAPKNMRSLAMAIFPLSSSLASALGEAFVVLAADPLLVWNYSVFGVITFIAGILIWISVYHLDADEDRLNNLVEGHMEDPNEKHQFNLTS